MSDTTNDIDSLLRMLNQDGWENYHAALTALVAERKALRKVNLSLVAEGASLRKRVETLELQSGRWRDQHPPADRDRELRERLVVAVYPILLAVAWGRPSGNTTAEDMADTLAAMRELAIVEADKMIAAMRKGESDGK